MKPSYEYQIQFLQNIQRILKEGSFSSTYKFALLHSIADQCVEKGSDDNSELTISVKELAVKFIDLYWTQTVEFPNNGHAGVLYQNNGQQAAIINQIQQVRKIDPRLSKIKSQQHYIGLQKSVSNTIKSMPLWKLQVLGDTTLVLDFLYPQKGKGNEITLKSGVCYCFRKFYGQIADMLHSAWIRWVQKASNNQTILGQNINLEDFLFESKRSNLQPFVTVLKEDQHNNCFYCDRQIRSNPEVDHFIPWSRYAVDLGHNFVLSHKSCNVDKSDYLASEEFLEKWVNRNVVSGKMLSDYFNDQNLIYDLSTSLSVSKWAYQQCSDSDSLVWAGYKNGFSGLSGQWSNLL